MKTITGSFGRPDPAPQRAGSDLLGQRVVLVDTLLVSPHPVNGAYKSGEVVGVNHTKLTAFVRCEIEVPLENLRRLS